MTGLRKTLALSVTAGLIGGAVASAALLLGPVGSRAVDRAAASYIDNHIDTIEAALQEAAEQRQLAAATTRIAKERMDAVYSAPGASHIDPTRHGMKLVFFSDFNCPYCKATEPMIERLMQDRPDLDVMIRELPIVHADISPAVSRIALALARQDKYGAFFIKAGQYKRLIDETGAMLIAKDTGANMDRLALDLADKTIQSAVDANIAIREPLGITGTPTFALGDKLYQGLLSYKTMSKLLDEAQKTQTAQKTS